ncbi:MAG: hypothetical protein ABF893_02330 [Gluconacetobacter liquefaciens]|uniref:Uncharacterized protein n=1 Tax=Gluconacetobacter liquefaciens TaxID=89584 RepID=A0A7W4JNN2_GLULI|nr:hypothetical protein [Gluconacetobacter liquefaciens]MBB2188108.1 hypothetical protein [Gluconacetobacter liquefaciens]
MFNEDGADPTTATMEIQPLQTNNQTRLSRIGMKVAIPPYPGIRHNPPVWTEPAMGILEMKPDTKYPAESFIIQNKISR